MESAEGRGSASLYGKGVVGFGGGGVWFSRCLDEKGQGKGAPLPYHVSGSVRVSGVWIRARKLEGELDVGGRRILRSHRGIHSSHCGTSLVRDKY